MKVCIYAAANKNTPKEYTDAGYELGFRIAEKGHDLIFGNGKHGLLGALASGAHDAGGKIIGIAPEWIEEIDDEYEYCDEYHYGKTMLERKEIFLEKSDIYIVCPGGYGTLDELGELLLLKAVNKLDERIILFNMDHFYDIFIEMLEFMAEKNVINESELDLYDVANSVDEVLKLLDES